jgi:hypothetical protein
MVEAVFTIYPELSQTNGDELFLFRRDEELMPLRWRSGLTPEIIG